MLKKLVFSLEAIAYMREQLASGNILAQRLLALPLEAGLAVSYLPEAVDMETARDFAHSITLRTGIQVTAEVEAEAVTFIAAYLRQADDSIAIFETQARPGDAWLTKAHDFQFFAYDTEVYGYVTSQEWHPSEVMAVFRHRREYPYVANLTSLPGDDVDHWRLEITLTLLEQLAERTVHILIGAYDGEGYIIWSVKTPDEAVTSLT